ncbi:MULTISPECIES: glycosyltransferase [Plantibacter]|uniref:glycosyltransferase n=1 Tax=Plantibacter TaxID=190323 RepID=UPI001782B7A4|nr:MULTISPECIES: glycosyltransferase [Plantibacter]MBD8103544.1 glycosyltransferase [Plantibacter sp. CFBP 8775]MBD8516602.1 glycosyltransferase [Plantibacter sp. CFBP 8804]MBD8533877.1 glycosyltransferase [Plantibacter sp. CFBP 13570]CAH0159724.1 Putative glycosyltransferase EpsH [Plantibacter cousiniae]
MLSIVIPCRNGAATLHRQLDALLTQESDEAFEIVVADNGSSDSTAEIVRRYARLDARVNLVDASGRPGINHARNSGVAASRGRIVLMCDADDVVRPGWLTAHTRAFAAGAECVGGAVDRRLPDGRLVTSDEGVYRTLWNVPWPVGANCGFARTVYDRVGGFDESFVGGGDETDFFWRAARLGFETIAVPDAVLDYTLRGDLRSVARQFFAYGRANVRLYREHRPAGMPRSPWWSMPAAVSSGVLLLLSSRPSSLRRRRAVERLCSRAGRLVESLRLRTLYL